MEEALRWVPDSDEGGEESATEVSEFDTEDQPRRAFGKRIVVSGDRADRQNMESGTDQSRVLIADDNADMRDYLRRLFAHRYDVIR